MLPPNAKPLLTEAQLIWSPVVANSAMNRERGASGVNSYEKELRVKPESFLAAVLRRSGRAAWLDLCCGVGNALLQTAAHFQHAGQLPQLTLQGVDLVDTFRLVPPGQRGSLTFTAAALAEWITPQRFDLITCSHGLHYLGDKLGLLEKSAGWLHPEGLFVAHLDLANIRLDAPDSPALLRRQFREAGFAYNTRTRLLRRVGPARVHFGLRYLGADDTTGPNYSGQPAVTSYYALA